MCIVRTRKKRNNFVIIDKTPLCDRKLSWKTRGILAFLMTKPDDWVVNVSNLVSESEEDGKGTIQSALKELEQHGYLIRYRNKDEKGQFTGWETLIFETPEDKEEWEKEHPQPDDGKTRRRENPTTGKPTDGLSDDGESAHILNNDLPYREVVKEVINEGVNSPPPPAETFAAPVDPKPTETKQTPQKPLNKSSANLSPEEKQKAKAQAIFDKIEAGEIDPERLPLTEVKAIAQLLGTNEIVSQYRQSGQICSIKPNDIDKSILQFIIVKDSQDGKGRQVNDRNTFEYAATRLSNLERNPVNWAKLHALVEDWKVWQSGKTIDFQRAVEAKRQEQAVKDMLENIKEFVDPQYYEATYGY